MSVQRNAMIAELKRVIIPVLRETGFRGSFPHFRRVGEQRIDPLTFQFSTFGEQFVVEEGVTSHCSSPGRAQCLLGRNIRALG